MDYLTATLIQYYPEKYSVPNLNQYSEKYSIPDLNQYPENKKELGIQNRS